MVGALTMSNVITLLQVPSQLTEAIVNSGLPTLAILLIIVLFYLALGMFLDGGSITVLTVPVIAPMLPVLGVDVVAFGVILMMLIETALLTPPVGLNIFTVKGHRRRAPVPDHKKRFTLCPDSDPGRRLGLRLPGAGPVAAQPDALTGRAGGR